MLLLLLLCCAVVRQVCEFDAVHVEAAVDAQAQ
jgi:hypothetical protein